MHERLKRDEDGVQHVMLVEVFSGICFRPRRL